MSKINRRKFLRNSSLLGVSTLFLSAGTGSIFMRSRGFDILIKNGTIIDGTGNASFIADVGIKEGKIIAIEKIIDADAGIIIDAKGLKVTPGFVDFHSHTDTDLILNPKAESKIRQGVTTEICGQDGSSWGPIPGRDIERRLKNFKENYGEELPWRTLGEFLDNFSRRNFSVNLASMVGLGTLREFAVGYDDRPATAEELKIMQYEIKKAIDEGAIGISSGLEYTPGSFASTEELIEVIKAAPLHARVYSTHMRNEDNTVLEAIDEAIRIARESNARLQLAHLKVSGKSNWHKADAALEKMDKAAAEGLDIHADRYTYVAYHTGLANLFPLWSRDGGTQKFLERLKNDSLKNDIKEFSEKKVSNLDGDWDGVLISSIGKENLKYLQGKTIKNIAEENGMDYFDAAVDVILKSENNVMMMGFGMEEESTEKILAHPRVMISSDAGSHAPYPPMTKSIAHPRAYGTFPRAIAKYVRERNICPLEEMIKKMTSMPADKAGLTDRGRLQKGKPADVVIFDYEKIQDKSEFTDSHQYPEGIPYVIVNGKIVIKNGDHSGEMPGKVLRT
jgi:N-acyl-D-amino-acid deacylase